MQMQKQMKRAIARNDGRRTSTIKPQQFSPAMPPGIELACVTTLNNGRLVITTQRKGAQ